MGVASNFQENIFFHYILGNQIFLNTVKPEFFTNSNVREIFEIAKDHTLKYKESPTKDQMIQLISIKGLSDKYSDDLITSLYNTTTLLSEYDNEWLETNVSAWIQIRNLDSVMRKAIAFMKTTPITAETAPEAVEKVRHMLSSETAIDFSFDLGSDFFDPASHLQTRLARTPTGYDFIDLCTDGGYWKGSLIILLGAPKSGKTTWCCNLAAKSVLMGYNTAYITLELQRELVNKRIGANLLNVPLEEYDKLTKDQPLLKSKLTRLKEKSLQPLGELHVKEFPSSTASSNDIEAYLLKAQELLGYKFDNVFIDYVNIMKNWRNPNTENTYMKIKQICEDVRAMGQRNDWAIVSVTQTNRCLDPNTVVYHKERGEIKIQELKIGDFILGDEGYTKINNIYINKNVKTYKIKTKSGKEIICSANHIFPVNNSLQQVSNMKKGDKIYIKKA